MKEIPLRGKKAEGRVALVDDEDYALVVAFRWNISPSRPPGTFYARHGWRDGSRARGITMHNLIMGCKGIDHADRNGLNNQRSNLRIATQSQNNANTRPRQGTSIFKGVHWSQENNNWRASIRVNGKLYSLGRYTSEVAAALIYDAAAREAFGEFARTNFGRDRYG